MRHLLRRRVRRILHGLGYEIGPLPPPWPRDFQREEIDLCRAVAPYTMTSLEAISVLAHAVRHVVATEVQSSNAGLGEAGA